MTSPTNHASGNACPNPRQHLRPEPVGDGVGGVEAPAVGAAPQPVRHHVDGVVDHIGVVVVQRDQLAVTLERRRSRCRRWRNHAGRVLRGVAIAREVGADMVEHAVEQDPQTRAGAPRRPVRRSRRRHRGAGRCGSGRWCRSRACGKRISGRARYRTRPSSMAWSSHSMMRRSRCSSALGGGSAGKRADEAERVDLPPDRVLDPARFSRMSARAETLSWPELRFVQRLHGVGELGGGPVDDDPRRDGGDRQRRHRAAAARPIRRATGSAAPTTWRTRCGPARPRRAPAAHIGQCSPEV